MKKILPKDRIRSEKGAGKQAKRWRNSGHEHAPTNELPEPRRTETPANIPTRRGARRSGQALP